MYRRPKFVHMHVLVAMRMKLALGLKLLMTGDPFVTFVNVHCQPKRLYGFIEHVQVLCGCGFGL